MLPAPALGGVARVRAGLPREFVELALLGLLPRAATLDADRTRGAELYWLGVQLDGCTLAPGDWFACLGVEGGQMAGTGFGVRHPNYGSGLWLAPGAQAVLRWQVARDVHFEVAVGGFVALLRPSFSLDGADVVHQPRPISARLELGIGWKP